MDQKKGVIVSILFIVALVGLFYSITFQITKHTGYFIFNKDSRESEIRYCLENNPITLYINSENPEKTLKTMNSAKYFDSIKKINCLDNQELCIKNKISSFPTFVINNTNINKDLTVPELTNYAKCKLS